MGECGDLFLGRSTLPKAYEDRTDWRNSIKIFAQFKTNLIDRQRVLYVVMVHQSMAGITPGRAREDDIELSNRKSDLVRV